VQPFMCCFSDTTSAIFYLVAMQIIYRTFLIALKQGWRTCGPRAKCGPHKHLIWPASEFSLLELEHNIALKRNTVISRHVDSKPREISRKVPGQLLIGSETWTKLIRYRTSLTVPFFSTAFCACKFANSHHASFTL